MLLDYRHPCFRNFDSTISVDVIRMKYYVDGLFKPTSVPVWVMINKLSLVPNWKVPGLVRSDVTAEVWVRAGRLSLSCSFILSCIDLLVFLI